MCLIVLSSVGKGNCKEKLIVRQPRKSENELFERFFSSNEKFSEYQSCQLSSFSLPPPLPSHYFVVFLILNSERFEASDLIGHISVNNLAIIVLQNIFFKLSELDYQIWNANWRMICEVRIAAYGG